MPKPFVKSTFKAMGTEIFIQIVLKSEKEKPQARSALDKTQSLYRKLEKIFSRFDSQSELCRLNKNIGVFQSVSRDMARLASRALYYHKESEGIYDPRIIGILESIGYKKDFKKTDFPLKKPTPALEPIRGPLSCDLRTKSEKILFNQRMDFSGIAKGYITDRATTYLKKQGWKNFLVDSGGDIYAAGKNRENGDWKIAIEEISKQKVVLAISEKGIATSGITRKNWRVGKKPFHHLVNPKNPSRFSRQIKTVSVIEDSAEMADGKAKALLIMGEKLGKKTALSRKYKCVFLGSNGKIWVSPEAKKYLEPVQK